jgi:DNA repair protein RecO (recombination protein O)
MIDKTEAIVLKWHPVTNTSRIVSWFTRDHGRITTMIKGSQRPNSLFLGQYDLFYTCELLYYTHERNDLHHTRECSPLKLRENLRNDWRAAAAASFFTDIVLRVCPPRASHSDIYELLDQALDEINQHGVNFAIFFWFELRLLQVLGHAPQLAQCIDCQEEQALQVKPIVLAYERGAILCPRCVESDYSHTGILTPAARAIMLNLEKCQAPEDVRNTRTDPGQAKEIAAHMSRFMEYHMETSLRSQHIAIDIMMRQTPHSRGAA